MRSSSGYFSHRGRLNKTRRFEIADQISSTVDSVGAAFLAEISRQRTWKNATEMAKTRHDLTKNAIALPMAMLASCRDMLEPSR